MSEQDKLALRTLLHETMRELGLDPNKDGVTLDVRMRLSQKLWERVTVAV